MPNIIVYEEQVSSIHLVFHVYCSSAAQQAIESLENKKTELELSTKELEYKQENVSH